MDTRSKPPDAEYLTIYVRGCDLPLLERVRAIARRRREQGRRDYAIGAILIEALAYWLKHEEPHE